MHPTSVFTHTCRDHEYGQCFSFLQISSHMASFQPVILVTSVVVFFHVARFVSRLDLFV